MRTALVARDLDHVGHDAAQQLHALVRARALEQLLAEVVAVRVRHQLVHRISHLLHYEVHHVRRSLRQHSLQVLRALLRARQLMHLSFVLVHALFAFPLYLVELVVRSAFLNLLEPTRTAERAVASEALAGAIAVRRLFRVTPVEID